MFRTYRRARLLIALGVVSGVSLAGVLAWATGLLSKVTGFVEARWDQLTTWYDSLSWDTILASLGVIAVPAIIVLLLIAIINDG